MKDNILCFYCVFVSHLAGHHNLSQFTSYSLYDYRVGRTSLHLVLGNSVGRAVATSEAVGGGDGRPQRFAPHLHVGPCGHHGSNCEN